MNQELGKRYPAHAGATGKVLLANLPPDELDKLLGTDELEQLTDTTVTDRANLDADLDRIREAAVGVSHGERVPDAVAISAPVFDAGGRAVAAVTIDSALGTMIVSGPGQNLSTSLVAASGHFEANR